MTENASATARPLQPRPLRQRSSEGACRRRSCIMMAQRPPDQSQPSLHVPLHFTACHGRTQAAGKPRSESAKNGDRMLRERAKHRKTEAMRAPKAGRKADEEGAGSEDQGSGSSGTCAPSVYPTCTDSSWFRLSQPSPQAATSGAPHRRNGLPIHLRFRRVGWASTFTASPSTKRLWDRLRQTIERRRNVLQWRLNH